MSAMVEDFKCDLAQGYYMAPPMPTGQVGWLAGDAWGLASSPVKATRAGRRREPGP